MQALFDLTHRNKVTRDRSKNNRLPDRQIVERVERVENTRVWAEYATRRAEIAEESRQRGNATCIPDVKTQLGILPGQQAGLDTDAQEMYLFHGTNRGSALQISRSDFWTAFSSELGLYGGGLYFAENATKSDEYCAEEDGLCTMLVCRVCMGDAYVLADKEFDLKKRRNEMDEQKKHSLLGDREAAVGTYREFITYDSSAACVEYIVSYRRAFGDDAIATVEAMKNMDPQKLLEDSDALRRAKQVVQSSVAKYASDCDNLKALAGVVVSGVEMVYDGPTGPWVLVGDEVLVHDTEDEPWKPAIVEELKGNHFLANFDGNGSRRWREARRPDEAGGMMVYAFPCVGEEVEVRNDETEEWKAGKVGFVDEETRTVKVCLRYLDRPGVEWKQGRPFDLRYNDMHARRIFDEQRFREGCENGFEAKKEFVIREYVHMLHQDIPEYDVRRKMAADFIPSFIQDEVFQEFQWMKVQIRIGEHAKTELEKMGVNTAEAENEFKTLLA
eukprot:gnl/MRDRNA2_/MRDRNA2_15205_c0_seq1.p1 gnl/MRDRNA2_/MRDRNA2_15205_c0~~gnl/MRDRNA2_/MRDRNA2_15205_c0_seq1.p1  ORF type:complete len:501 (+),score=103.78 gnl/MRDRNA2_/MRDRNA2_15205_c0_seq1:587-2089(+)